MCRKTLLEAFNIHLVSAAGALRRNALSRQDLADAGGAVRAHAEATRSIPSTSQPSPADLRRQFDFLASHYESVLSVNVSARASGTWQAAAAARQRTSRPDAIYTMDTGTVSMGQGLIAVYAAECAREGFDLATTRRLCEEITKATKAYAYVRDLRYAVRGGRIPASVKMIADLFRLSPVLTNMPDGRVSAGGVLLGRRNLPAKLTRFIAARHSADQHYRIFIGHGGAPNDVPELRSGLLAAFPQVESCHETDVGTALAVHGGPGMVVVGLQAYVPPRELATKLGLALDA
jgi:DegV family protein with EDD domain